MSVLAFLLIGIGSALLVIAAWGVIALPDALSRQHAATKAGTLALALVLVGAWLLVPSAEWGWRLALILGFLLATLPVASHLLARAAVVEGGMEEEIREAPLVGSDPERP
jgi:multicomponent Na+:H+ antiporter subunit G